MGKLFDLTGKSAIVTGSSRGIGRAIAHRLAEQGAQVVVCSRDQTSCDSAAGEINSEIGRSGCIGVAADIADKSSLRALVDRAETAFGAIDILVCNAASNHYMGPLQDIDDEALLATFKENVISSHWLVQMTAPQMRARKNGSIIIISSVAGFQAAAMIGAYAISKAADVQMVRQLALELGEDNVRVNAIAPGLIKTEFARVLWENPETLAAINAQSCLKRIGQPDEIAGMAVFLASDAGAFATGQTFLIDGGAASI